MTELRHYTLLDQCCLRADEAVRALFGIVHTTGQKYPAEKIKEAELTIEERKKSAALMRINHAGEICAQALYHGQGMLSQNAKTQLKMQTAAREEGDHLFWCQKRLLELGSHSSYLNPLWYTGSFCIGLIAGKMGDAWSLGFVAETEQQVIKHLNGHLHRLPNKDKRSQAILEQMSQDEAKHREEALSAGGRELPFIIKKIMSLTAKIMVKTAYWV